MNRLGVFLASGMCSFFVSCSVGAAVLDQGADLDAAISGAREDVRAQGVALNEVRDRLGEKRALYAGRLESLTTHVAALRREVDAREASHAVRQERLQSLRNEQRQLNEALSFVRLACREYGRGMGARCGGAAAATLDAQWQALDAAFVPAGDLDTFLSGVASLVEQAERWNRQQLGGFVARTEVADEAGIVRQGAAVVVGPVGWFVADDEETCGIVVTRPGSPVPGLHLLEEIPALRVRNAAQGDVVDLPMDLCGGDAFKVVAARPGLVEQWVSGGFVMYPLALVGLGALLLVLMKVVSLSRMDVSPEFPDELGVGAIEKMQRVSGPPVAPLLEEALANRTAPRAHLEELLAENVAAQVPLFERHLGTLAVLGGVAPLLGLLGTVTGMIHTFQLVNSLGTGNARLLSGGISEALTTTKFGLALAIPILLIHAFLARRARVKLAELEHTASRVAQVLHAGRQEKGD